MNRAARAEKPHRRGLGATLSVALERVVANDVATIAAPAVDTTAEVVEEVVLRNRRAAREIADVDPVAPGVLATVLLEMVAVHGPVVGVVGEKDAELTRRCDEVVLNGTAVRTDHENAVGAVVACTGIGEARGSHTDDVVLDQGPENAGAGVTAGIYSNPDVAVPFEIDRAGGVGSETVNGHVSDGGVVGLNVYADVNFGRSAFDDLELGSRKAGQSGRVVSRTRQPVGAETNRAAVAQCASVVVAYADSDCSIGIRVRCAVDGGICVRNLRQGTRDQNLPVVVATAHSTRRDIGVGCRHEQHLVSAADGVGIKKKLVQRALTQPRCTWCHRLVVVATVTVDTGNDVETESEVDVGPVRAGQGAPDDVLGRADVGSVVGNSGIAAAVEGAVARGDDDGTTRRTGGRVRLLGPHVGDRRAAVVSRRIECLRVDYDVVGSVRQAAECVVTGSIRRRRRHPRFAAVDN